MVQDPPLDPVGRGPPASTPASHAGVEELARLVADLRRRLAEAEETIRAIREDEVDAFVVARGEAERVLTLETADRPYRVLVESMQQGALTLAADGTILYGNPRIADLLGRPQHGLVGRRLSDLAPAPQRSACDSLLREGLVAGAQGEALLARGDGTTVPVHLAVSPLPVVGATALCVLVTDLTERKSLEELRLTQAALRQSRDELEARVAERTADLARANAALTELLRRLVTAQEDERRRVARDLHDGLGQELTALILGLKALERAVPAGSPGRERLREVEAIVGRIGREAHDLAVDLRPTALDDIGLGAALAAYVTRWSDRTGVAADFQPMGLDGGRLPPEVETTVYRVVQEALNNIARHAAARRVSVIVERRGDELTALIEDDGRGFDPGLAASGPDPLRLGLPTTGRAGHNSRLAVAPDGRHLVAANTDNGSISLVDLEARALVAEVPVGKGAEGVCYLGDAPRVAVTLWHEDRVAVVDLDAKAVVRRIDVPDEPYGVVASADGRRIYVTHAYPGLVTEIDPDSGAVLRRFEVGDTPKGLALSPDGSRLLVTHYYTAWLSAIDLATGRVVDRWKGPAADNLARSVTAHPTRPVAYIPHIRSRVERAQATGSIFPFVTVVDLKPGEGRRRVPIAMDNYNGITPVSDPWEVAVSPDGRRQYTIYAGTDDMNVSEAADGYPYLVPVTGLVPLGRNPRAIAVAPDGREVFVLNALDFSVRVFRAEPFEKVAEITLCRSPYPEPVLVGKRLFHRAKPPMTSRRWISCNSCHPGGDHDGRTWQQPEGKRNTPALFGMARTYPLHWSADRDELHDFEHTIRGPLMQGTGLVRGPIPAPLGEPLAGRSPELDDLAAYCNGLEPDPSPHALGPARLSPEAERGRLLFESERTGCASCHPAPTYTDSRPDRRPFVLHDVGTGAGDPTEQMGPAYDTPSLIGIYRSAPYLHDGRAATLRDVLTTHNPADRHGRTSHLSAAEVDDLVAFLKSLPYRPESLGPPPPRD